MSERAYVSACMRARVCVSEAQWRDNLSGNIKIEILNISGENEESVVKKT